MSSSISVPPPGFVPRPQPPPDELMTGVPVDRSLLQESRRRLDARRFMAHMIDGMIVLVCALPFQLYYGADLGVTVFAASLLLTYHFLLELARGQSIGKRALGLRVVMADGSPLTIRAASARSVLRLLDEAGPGIVVYLLSGGRRRRIGDYAGGTIVCDATRVGLHQRPLRLGDAAYPVVWLTIGLALLVLSSGGHTPWSYRARADRVCAIAHRFLGPGGATSPADVAAVHSQLAIALARLRPPPNWRWKHQQLVSRIRDESTAMMTPMQGAMLEVQLQSDQAAVRGLGYRDCAAV